MSWQHPYQPVWLKRCYSLSLSLSASGICQGVSWQHLHQPCVAGQVYSLSLSPPQPLSSPTRLERYKTFSLCVRTRDVVYLRMYVSAYVVCLCEMCRCMQMQAKRGGGAGASKEQGQGLHPTTSTRVAHLGLQNCHEPQTMLLGAWWFPAHRCPKITATL